MTTVKPRQGFKQKKRSKLETTKTARTSTREVAPGTEKSYRIIKRGQEKEIWEGESIVQQQPEGRDRVAGLMTKGSKPSIQSSKSPKTKRPCGCDRGLQRALPGKGSVIFLQLCGILVQQHYIDTTCKGNNKVKRDDKVDLKMPPQGSPQGFRS